MLTLLLTLALAQGCPTVQPGPDWVCVNGGWLPPGILIPSMPGTPLPSPQPPTDSRNRIEVTWLWLDDWLPGELRLLRFRLLPYGPLNCDGATAHTWTSPMHLKVLGWDAWMGANHDAPAVDIRTTATVTYAAGPVPAPAYRWSWERYRATDFNLPDRPFFSPYFIRLDEGAKLTVEFFCSRAVGRNTGYLADFLVLLTAR